jgi:type III secretion protein K
VSPSSFPAAGIADTALLPFSRPLASRLIEFNLLPSRSLHPSRLPSAGTAGERLCAQPRVLRTLHRQWSAALLQDMGAAARPVQDLAEPALPLALASPGLLAGLARDAGTVLLGRRLRHVIRRDEVAAARAGLGDAGLALARDAAGTLHPGLHDTAAWLPVGGLEGLVGAADLLGYGLLGRAWEDAPAPLRLRADLTLPEASDAAAVRGAAGLAAPAARSLCLRLLARLDSPWLSLFPNPATR